MKAWTLESAKAHMNAVVRRRMPYGLTACSAMNYLKKHSSTDAKAYESSLRDMRKVMI